MKTPRNKLPPAKALPRTDRGTEGRTSGRKLTRAMRRCWFGFPMPHTSCVCLKTRFANTCDGGCWSGSRSGREQYGLRAVAYPA